MRVDCQLSRIWLIGRGREPGGRPTQPDLVVVVVPVVVVVVAVVVPVAVAVPVVAVPVVAVAVIADVSRRRQCSCASP